MLILFLRHKHEIDAKVELRTGSTATTSRGCSGGLREHDALATIAHLTTTLRRFHRLPEQGAGHVRVGARRSGALLATDREHHGGVQGEEEAGATGAATVPVRMKVTETVQRSSWSLRDFKGRRRWKKLIGRRHISLEKDMRFVNN